MGVRVDGGEVDDRGDCRDDRRDDRGALVGAPHVLPPPVREKNDRRSDEHSVCPGLADRAVIAEEVHDYEHHSCQDGDPRSHPIDVGPFALELLVGVLVDLRVPRLRGPCRTWPSRCAEVPQDVQAENDQQRKRRLVDELSLGST